MTGTRTLDEIVRSRAEVAAESRAYGWLAPSSEKPEWLTYGELDRRARAVGAALQAQGAAGERALLLAPSGLDAVVGFVGALYGGAIPVPAYPPDLARPARSSARLTAIAADAEARFVLARAEVALEEAWQEDPVWRRMRWVDPSRPEADPEAWTELTERPDLAYLQYTSGSTGAPSGVEMPHETAIGHALELASIWGQGDGSMAVSWLPNFHDLGLVTGVLLPLCAGFPGLFLDTIDFVHHPRRWLEAITQHRATLSAAPNFAFELCVRKIPPERRKGLDLRSWEVVCNGAEPVRARTLGRFADAFAPYGFRPETMRPSYGLAEATLVVSTSTPASGPPMTMSVRGRALEDGVVEPVGDADADAVAVVSVGTAMPSGAVRVVDPESRRPSANGGVGEIWCRGPAVARGYWRRPASSDETFRAVTDDGEGPFLRTGDLGFVWDGQLFVAGRLKDLIIVGGRNIYPQDVEWTAEDAHAAVRPGCTAAFAVEGGDGLGEAVGLVAEVADEEAADEVLDAIWQAVAETHAVTPGVVALLRPGMLPKTSSGKVRRARCRQGLVDGSLARIAERRSASVSEPPPTAAHDFAELAEWLVKRVAATLGVAPADVHTEQPLAEMGLGSLSMVALLGELEDRVGGEIPAHIVYEHPTITALARRAAHGGGVARPAPARRRGSRYEPVAIVGMACRMPGANSPEELWAMLREGGDPIREVPAERWDINEYYDPHLDRLGAMSTKWGGFVDGIDMFDASFFGYGPREARSLDPQHRLLLETAWEVFEDARIPPSASQMRSCGVYVGIATWDYLDRIGRLYPRDTTGNALSAAANRISYAFDLHGPSMALDTACSSSLVALHLAAQSLGLGECDAALAGGVNVILHPENTAVFSLSGAMAADGRCKTFDANADGYVRAEGCGMVLLKRLADAEADGDEVLAVLRGSAINNDGRGNGFTAPNGLAHREVVRQAMLAAGVSPEEIGYVEAHGTATPLGDPVEVAALASVLRPRGPDSPRCHLGSVKATLGHLEPAAGIAGLLKCVLMLRHGEIPPQLHLRDPNPALSLERTPFAIPRELTAWDASRRIAAINSFGAGGTNAHAILEEGPRMAAGHLDRDQGWHLLPIAAKKPAALDALAEEYAGLLTTGESPPLAAICQAAAIGRTHFDARLAVVAPNRDAAAAVLGAAPRDDARTFRGTRPKTGSPRVAFLFPGQSSPYPGMATALYADEPVFRESLDRCAELLRGELDVDLLELIFPAPNHQWDLLERTEHQVAAFAIDYSLAEMWRAWGIEPAAVMGHSMGELVAVCVAGAVDLEPALRLVVERGRVQQLVADAHDGAMAAVLADREAVLAAIGERHDEVGIAAYNGPSNIAISGLASAVDEVLEALAREGHLAKSFPTPGPAHSPMFGDDVLERFRAAAAKTAFGPARIPVASNRSGALFEEAELRDPDYWARHMRDPVDFCGGIQTLIAHGCDTFLEVGPGRSLVKLGRRCAPDADVAWLHTIRSDEDERRTMLEALGALYARGADVDWARVHAGAPAARVRLPRYPWQRRRYWIDTTIVPVAERHRREE